MNVFVIGGTGFISGRLVDFLLEENHQVTVLTRGFTPRKSEKTAKLSVIKGDRDNPSVLREAVEDRNFDVLYDMIAYLPQQTASVIEAFKGRIGRLIHCSTISVYMVSDKIRIPVTEEQDTLPLMHHFPRNPFGMDYGINKRECEILLWEAHEKGSTAVTMLRPTYVSGPGDPTLRDYFWIERILDGKPLLVPGGGNYAFQQVFVDDVARAFADLLKHPETSGQAYNIASDEVFTLNSYLDGLSSMLGKSPERIHIDQTAFDQQPFSSVPNADVFPFNTRRSAIFSLKAISKAIGYKSTPFTEWMPRTIEWYIKSVKGHSHGYNNRGAEVDFALSWRNSGKGKGDNLRH